MPPKVRFPWKCMSSEGGAGRWVGVESPAGQEVKGQRGWWRGAASGLPPGPSRLPLLSVCTRGSASPWSFPTSGSLCRDEPG